MADNHSPAPSTNPEPQGTHWLEEVKQDAEHNFLKRLREQEADKEYEAQKAAAKKK